MPGVYAMSKYWRQSVPVKDRIGWSNMAKPVHRQDPLEVVVDFIELMCRTDTAMCVKLRLNDEREVKMWLLTRCARFAGEKLLVQTTLAMKEKMKILEPTNLLTWSDQ